MSKKWATDVDWKERYNQVQQDFINFKVGNAQCQKELTNLKRMLAKIAPSALEQFQLLSHNNNDPTAPSLAPQTLQQPQRLVPSQPLTSTPNAKKKSSKGKVRSQSVPKVSLALQPPSAPSLPAPPPPSMDSVKRVLQNLQQAAVQSKNAAVSPMKTMSPMKRVHVVSSEVGLRQQPQIVQPWADTTASISMGMERLPPMHELAWGCDSTLAAAPTDLTQTVVHMRNKLHDAEVVITALRDELLRTRDGAAKLSSMLDETRAERNHMLMERDVLAQMLETRNVAFRSLTEDRETIAIERNRMAQDCNHAMDLKRAQELEAKRAELNMNEQMQSLANALKEKSAVLTAANVKLSVAESNLRGMRESNEAMLNEMRTLNQQLVAERQTVIALTRDAQGNLGTQAALDELRRQLESAQQEVCVLQAVQLDLLSQYAKNRNEDESALRGQFQHKVSELEESAGNWERVAQVQWKELQQLSSQHSSMKAEFDSARAHRDTLELELDATRKTLELTQTKLRVLCPMADEVCDVENSELRTALAWIHRRRTGGVGETPGDEASGALIQTLDRTKKTVALLNERLAEIQKTSHTTEEDLKRQVEALRKREQRTEAERTRRIAELENQVVSMRQQVGQVVDKDTSMLELNTGEVMFELYLGRMDVAVAHRWTTHQPQMVVTADFLVHETSVTDMVFGWTPTLDAYFSYRVDTDDILMYYLCTQKLKLSVLKVIDGAGTTSPLGTAELSLQSLVESTSTRRRKLQGVAQVVNNNGEMVCGLEYQLTVRGEFSPSFLALQGLMVPELDVPDSDSALQNALTALRGVVAPSSHSQCFIVTTGAPLAPAHSSLQLTYLIRCHVSIFRSPFLRCCI
jgi:hypothetical protein